MEYVGIRPFGETLPARHKIPATAAHGLVEYDGWRQRKRDARMQASFERAMAAGSLDEEAYAFAVGEEGKRSAERDETVNWVVGVLGTLALVRLVFQWLFR